jgi:4-amino-4-deoxy-L-arabinose transferase-like glycosyltransferase
MKLHKKIILAVVLLLGIGLRLHQYAFIPFAGHAEEYLFVWSGLSLIEKGVPISWNDLPPYKEEHVYWQGVVENKSGRGELGVRLLKPWLDEPPLFSLMEGGIAKLYGQENFTIISPYVIRIPPLIFSFISLILVYVLAKKLYDYKTAILSLLFYGTAPVIVFGSRLVAAENFFVPILLSIVLLLISYFKQAKNWKVYLATFLAVLAALAKPTGLLFVPFIVFWLWKRKEWKKGFVLGAVGMAVFFITYFAYGFSYDKQLFLDVFRYQSQRPAGFSGLAHLITSPGFSISEFLDGFVVLGFLSLVYMIYKRKKDKPNWILFTFLYTVLIVLFSGGKGDQLCWYRYPIYPFMSISAALMIKEAISKPDFFKSSLLIPLLLTNGHLLQSPFRKIDFFLSVKFFRFSLVVLLGPAILYMLFKKKMLKKFMRISIIIALVGGLIYNVWVIKDWFHLECAHSLECSLPHKVDLLKPLKQLK